MELVKSIEDLSDLQLLELLCSIEDDKIHYDHFVSRFLLDIKEHCARISRTRNIDPHIGEQIAHDTFERLRKYKKFNKEESKIANERRGILVYLKSISIRLFNDYHKSETRKEVIHTTYFEDILVSLALESDVVTLRNKRDTAKLIFSKLNKKEQVVVLRDIEYRKHQKYLPDEVTIELAEELNVKPATIRKIRERAILKIKKAINEINQN